MAIAVFASVVAILLAGILLMRFRKRWLAAFNLAVTNRISSRFAPRLPGFGIVTHVGRKSGRVYRTPVNVFRAPNGFLNPAHGLSRIALFSCDDFHSKRESGASGRVLRLRLVRHF